MTKLPPTVIVLMLTLEMAACGSPMQPTGPTSPVRAPAVRPAVPQGGWALTTTLTSVTGNKSCGENLAHLQVGGSYDAWLLTIERSGSSINLIVSDLRNPTERYEYEGTVVGETVKAEIENYDVGAGWCGGRVAFTNESYLTGRFSEAGRTFTGEVVDSVHLDVSGEEIELHTDWSAVQQ